MECPICINEFTNSKITCPSCQYSACKECYKTYILNSGKEFVYCMNCNIRFNRSTMLNMFGKHFLTKTLLDYQKDVRFKIQQSHFPEVLPIVEHELNIKKLQKKRQEVNLQIKQLKAPFLKKIKDLEDEMNKLTHSLVQQERDLEEKVITLSYENHIMRYENEGVAKTKTYTRTCLNNGCDGFLDNNFRCGMCNTSFCKDCYETLPDDNAQHVCDPNIKENIKLLKKDTRNCPRCSTGIHKIDGCNQMFCTQCNTAFDWKTGDIETGAIHNPHYYEYLRRNTDLMPTVQEIQRQFNRCNDNGCHQHQDMSRDLHTIVRSFKNKKEHIIPFIESIYTIIRLYEHYQHAINVHRNENRTLNDKQRELRIKYLLKEMPRNKFDTLISKDLKKVEYNEEIILIMSTVIDIARDNALKRHQDILS
eukprot:762415-Hanusia_phi.AAC.2